MHVAASATIEATAAAAVDAVYPQRVYTEWHGLHSPSSYGISDEIIKTMTTTKAMMMLMLMTMENVAHRINLANVFCVCLLTLITRHCNG